MELGGLVFARARTVALESLHATIINTREHFGGGQGGGAGGVGEGCSCCRGGGRGQEGEREDGGEELHRGSVWSGR